MKNIKKIISLTLSSLLLLSTTCSAVVTNPNKVTILDLRASHSTYSTKNFDCLIVNESDLSNAIELSNELSTPVFIETQNLDVNDLLESTNVDSNLKTESLSEKAGLIFKGYLLYNKGSDIAIPWYIEDSISDDTFKDDLKSKLIEIKNNTDLLSQSINKSSKDIEWPIEDSYATNVSYTEGTVGISGILHRGSTYVGAQVFNVQVNPRGAGTYTDYSCEGFDNTVGASTGKVLDWSPSSSSGYSSSITINYPWSVSASFSFNSSLKVSYLSGGIGNSYTEWRFKPRFCAYNMIKGESVIKFQNTNGSSVLKSNVRTEVTFRTTQGIDGSSSTRKVNYNTAFSS